MNENNKEKSSIKTYIQLFLNNVELNIEVTNTLDAKKNFGYVRITDGGINTEPAFWDNLDFFVICDKKEFKKECKKELKEKGYNWKTTYKEIKTLLKRAKKLNIVTE